MSIELVHPLSQRGEIALTLEHKLRALHDRHRRFFGGLMVDDARVKRVANTWAATMCAGMGLGFSYEKELLVLALFPERHEAAFWGTAVGRALAWLGSAADANLKAGEDTGSDPVPQAGAGNALGITKQRASQLTAEGRLAKHWDARYGVTRASLSALMRERWPAPLA